MMKRAAAVFAAMLMASQAVPASAADISLGDADMNGEINVTDIAVTAAHIKGIRALDEKGQTLADVNRDGNLDVTDIAIIAAHIKGIKAIEDNNKGDALTEPTPAYTDFSQYQDWEKDVGYTKGLLVPRGVDVVNMDYFHTSADSPAYTSGRIVIGDSRCCQLGIYQQRTDRNDFAIFSVWGGHFLSGTEAPILTDELIGELEACFHEQIRTNGSCTIYFFATINDYDYVNNYNDGNISAAVSAAEGLASMSYEYNGTVYHPDVRVIGFDGGHTYAPIFSIPQDEFNRYITDYNDKLSQAVKNSSILGEYTTVPAISGGTDFIDDGLHYGDRTLKKLIEYMIHN